MLKRWISAIAVATASTLALGQAAEGEVRKIDKAAGKITIKHGEIKSLDMPPMTMVFRAEPPSLLDKVQVGDKVSFQAAKVGGTYTVTAIEKR
ncbi:MULTISPECIES: copper-binding protein [Caldimonas]|jgi:Cu(I)/Ag(I) efflux system protein CusF|uniref:copper-binding protein n=1 Tax=Caldimonas TaxID=196013 RepID=UPI0003703253|nr:MULTISPECIES: copper-binding protein [Caldimonas]MCX7659463.1 copper-binding protein [Caldimonas manganoxidans]GIX22908.1 MAG: RND transporter [Caldimonas sp.]